MASSSRQPTEISRKRGAAAVTGGREISVELEEYDDLQTRRAPNATDLSAGKRGAVGADDDNLVAEDEDADDGSTNEHLPPHLLRSSCSELFLELFSRYYACGLEKQTAFFDFLEARGFVDSTGKPQFILNQLGQRITFLSKTRFPTYRPTDDDSESEGDDDGFDDDDDDDEEEILQDDDDDSADAELRGVTRSSSASNGLSSNGNSNSNDRRWASSLSFACGALGGESQQRSFFWNYIRFPQQTHYPRSYFRFARAFRQRVLLQEARYNARSSKPRSPAAVGDWAWEFSGPQPFPVIKGVVDGDILCTIFSGMMPPNIVYYRCPSASARIYIAVDISSSFPILPRRLLRLANDPKRFMFWLSTRFSYSLPRFLPAFPVIVGYFHTSDGEIQVTRTDDQTTLVAKKNGAYLGTVWFNSQGVIRRIHTLL